jgi:putative ABC transport system permease protein
MNPWPIVAADLRHLRWVAWAVPLLVAIAVAIGVAIGAQERALRTSSARAADDFDLLIGAPGSQAQLVLTTVYLQPEAVALLDGAVLKAIGQDARVTAAAPIAFGDSVRGYPVIGTTREFASRWGRIASGEGRLFASAQEAVIGADVKLALGDQITPSHGTGQHRSPLGIETPEEREHAHEGFRYGVVGRLPALGSPWDRAILVPIESVWELHGLGNGHAAQSAPIGPPFDAAHVPGIPAIVVKPKSVAAAYALRGQYRQGGTMALFPAEVLVSIYRAMGDVRDVLVVVSGLNNTLIFIATTILLIAFTGLRRRRYAVLRALGAPRLYVLLAVWLQTALLLTAGALAGLPLAFLATKIVALAVEASTGLALTVGIAASDLLFILALIGIGSAFSLIPALISYRISVSEALRS